MKTIMQYYLQPFLTESMSFDEAFLNVSIKTQLAFTYSKSTTETPEQCVKPVNDVAMVFLLLTFNIFHALC